MTTIRLMERGDIPACMVLAAHGWGPLFGGVSHVDFNEAFGPGWRPTFYVAATDAGGAVGMCAHNIAWLGYGIYSLTWLTVHPAFRGRGIASRLVDRCLQDLRPIARLILAETPSDQVWRLLERRGFEPLKSIPAEQDGTIEQLLAWVRP